MSLPRTSFVLFAAAAFSCSAAPVLAQSARERVEQLERELDELRAELARLRGSEDATGATSPARRMRWFEDHRAMVAASPHQKLRWHFLGPDNVSGRITDIASPLPRGRSPVLYAATASGGVWKTVNEGTTWEPIFDHEATASIGDVTIDPSDPDTIWVGTGEANIFRSSMAGCGVYRSQDAGATWQHLGLAATHTIARIVVDPTDGDTVWVAASGHEWTDNEERGVYKTTNGGKTWQRVLFIDERTGAIDLVMDPRDPAVVYAATWQRIRKRWNDPRQEDGYDGGGIYKTTDGGVSWQPMHDGLPAAEHRGRIGIDLCTAHPDTVYAFIDNYELAGEAPPADEEDSYGRAKLRSIEGAQIYRSDDGGKSWRKTSKSDRFMRGACSTYGWVFGQVRAHPVDPDTVYMMGLGLSVSHDGGESWQRLRGMHGDHHALWIDPEQPDYLVNGNDGGIAMSWDGGKNWRTSYETLPAVQFYNVGVDMAEPFHVYGSIQDHGSRRGTVVISRNRKRITGRDWQGCPGGEASIHAVDATQTMLYSEGFYGSINRTELATGKRARIKPQPGKGEPELRGQWLAPFLVSPHNPRIVYHGMNKLFRTLDQGDHWTCISPDLSYADPNQLGDIPYQTIFSIAESHQTFGVLYVGTDDGRLWRTMDSGGNWTEITAGLAERRWISRVEASRFASGTIYVAQNGKRNDDFTPYLWRSTDHGDTWQDIAAGIPGAPINVVREDPQDPSILYVGTDLGAYVSTDTGRTWNVLGGNLPTTYVHDMVVHPRDDVLVIATHGRGMYALDVRPLREEPETEAPVEESGASASGGR